MLPAQRNWTEGKRKGFSGVAHKAEMVSKYAKPEIIIPPPGIKVWEGEFRGYRAHAP